MSIFISEEFKESLIQDIKDLTNNLSIITAYCKKEALEYIDSNIENNSNISKKLLVRFRLDDLLAKSTDFSIYEYCKENNWQLFIQFNLHAKVYTIDNKICYLGSANTTNSGLSLIKDGNLEIIKKFELNDYENKQLEQVFSETLLMTDELYEKMRIQLNSIEYHPNSKHTWNRDIIAKNINKYNVLFQDDFPINCTPLDLIDDEPYLEISKNDNIDDIKEKFYNAKVLQWLINLLENTDKNEIYFGALSQQIHNIIFQEPVQYRENVKILQTRLYKWIDELNYDNIKIDIPNYSQRIRLIK